MEVAVFSFGASAWVTYRPHISTQVQSTGPVIVTRFFFHMCVFLEAPWVCKLFMDDNAPCHRTVAAEQPSGERLVARTLPPVTIRELQLCCKTNGNNASTTIDNLILSINTSIAVNPPSSQETHIPLLQDRIFLAGHPSQGCFGLQSHCVPCYFFNQLLFIPLISLLISVAYITRPYALGSYGIKCVDLETFAKNYIEKTVSSLIFAQQCKRENRFL
ncbi:transposable element Tcb2 transposase [Trichonephila clavipes]|nr:transposable element Tcb2 transposase [Trichonephila clavipes]